MEEEETLPPPPLSPQHFSATAPQRQCEVHPWCTVYYNICLACGQGSPTEPPPTKTRPPVIMPPLPAKALPPLCDKHPWIKATSSTQCIACAKVGYMVYSAGVADQLRGRGTSTMTTAYVNALQNTPCMYCGETVRTDAVNNSNQLSANRVDPTKPHDCDPSQTRACCWPCNWVQCSLTRPDTLRCFIETANSVDSGEPCFVLQRWERNRSKNKPSLQSVIDKARRVRARVADGELR